MTALLSVSGGSSGEADDVLGRFVHWVSQSGLSLYPAQEEAILELLSNKHVVLATPTGSGKSLVATFLHFKAMSEGKRSFYTCPIKALVNEKFFALCQTFGAQNVGMMTGDASINPKAPIICCTAEILSNLCLRGDGAIAEYVVMDEFHYYADKERGVAWQVPLLLLEQTVFLLMSATLGDVSAIKESLHLRTGREVAEVKSAVRPVPLDFSYLETPLHETVAHLLAHGKAPVYLVNFTQRAAAEQAQNLMSVDLCTKEEKERIREALFTARFASPYGKDFQRFVRHGVGLHHAGLLPMYRLLVERLAQGGLLKVVSGTDTLGMGVNIPIRTVLFTQLCKFDGEKVGILSAREFRQISGRAGRKGFDDAGSVVVQAPEHVIENIALEKKKQAGKKVVKRQPPQKGYVHWDRQTFERLLTKEPEPLESRFQITHGLLLNLLQSARDDRGGYRRALELIGRSHSSDHVKRVLQRTAAAYLRTLWGAGIVERVRRTATEPARLAVKAGLQWDFSLNQTLSLFLVETLPKLDPALPSHALDVLTLVESILESPQVILWAQLDRLKDEKIAELKARGVEYQERMDELEKLEWPKPNREFVYAHFNEFARKHPWVGEENIRPKSVAREMFETCATFHDYVRDYGLQRAEGLLLRYLWEAYKTLVQTVPEADRTDEVEDVIAFLRAALERVDSSLLDEWERMRHPDAAVEAPKSPDSQAPRPMDLSSDPKAFAARVRADLHRLLKALAAKDYAEAAASIHPVGAWTAEQLEAELAPYWTEHPRIDVTPAARRPSHTVLTPDGAKRWSVRQRIVDPTGEADWMLDCLVDLSEPKDAGSPLIELRRIGT